MSGGGRATASARRRRLVDFLVLAGIFVFLASYFSPSLMLAPTTPTGGDMASHVYTASYLNESLLPQGRILGWMQGNLAGFPVFQLYFPLPFLLMALLSPMIGLPVAFKLVSVLGVFLLPFAAYVAFRRLGYAYPTPALAAAATLPFLMIESNSTWGGNIPSTLAGEFSYSLGLALALLFVATSYRGLLERRHLVANAILLALVGLSHAYALLFAGCVSAAHLLLRPERRHAWWYLARLFTLAFLLIGFWIVPLLAYSPHSSPYRDIWKIGGWQEVVPPILWPFVAVMIVDLTIRLVRHLRRSTLPDLGPGIGVLGNALWISGLLYLLAARLGAVDMRFLPFLQLFLVLTAAIPLGRWLGRATTAWMLPVLAAVAIATWVETRVTYIPQWIEWNYSGFESKPLWPVFSRINDYLRGDAGDPRVVFEHTPSHNAAGSIRAFESLPFFSGRSTLEGLYIQSSINTPFIFYAQSEYSQVASCPLPDYHCARLDPDRAAEHLRQFNVGQIIARSDRVKAALRTSEAFVLDREFPPYEIFRVLGNEGRYVVPLANEPILLQSDDWKRDSFRWFKRPGSSDVVLFRGQDTGGLSRGRISQVSLPETTPRQPLDASGVVVSERMGASDIRIFTNRPGHPLLIRISYHPRWRLESGGPVYLASPGFMLIYPENAEERLVFTDPPLVRLGWLMSGGAALIVLLTLVRRLSTLRSPATGGSAMESPPGTRRHPPRWVLLVPVTALALAIVLRAWEVRSYGPALYERGLELFHQDQWIDSQSYFERALSSAPLSSAAMHSSFYRALAAYKGERWEEALLLFTDMTALFPDGTYRPEADYHIGLALRRLGRTEPALATFRELRERFPETPWAGLASGQIVELEASSVPGRPRLPDVPPDPLPEKHS